MLHSSINPRPRSPARAVLVRGIASVLLSLAPAAHAAASPVPPQPVAPGVYVVMGERGPIDTANAGRVANIAFFIGPRGVVVVGSGASFRQGRDVIAAIGNVTRRPIRLVVLTHAGQEVVFGAAAFQAQGIPVLMHRNGADLMAARCEGCLRGLREALGEQTMAGSRIVTPDRLVGETQWLDVIGRPLLLIAPRGTREIGALAVLDPQTRTLVAGGLAAIERVPDMRDTAGQGWPDALAVLEATRCRHLVPALGRLGSCADIAAMERYFAALEQRMRELLDDGVGLAELPARCDLPQFAAWDGYATLHVQNANRAYLRLERESFIR